MYLNRPKSFKEPNRPSENPAVMTRSSEPERGSRSRCSSSLQADHVDQDQREITAPLLPLNKYKVLPSIQRRHSLDDMEKPNPGHPNTVTSTLDGNGSSSALLLAVRAPCGQRFQHHFHPSDTLMKVRDITANWYSTTYRRVSIHTMDVPRRTFTDLNMTLAQCGILNRSVLVITKDTQPTTEQEETSKSLI